MIILSKLEKCYNKTTIRLSMVDEQEHRREIKQKFRNYTITLIKIMSKKFWISKIYQPKEHG